MRFIYHTNMDPAARELLEVELSSQQNLSDVIKWTRNFPVGTFLPSVVSNVVVQDEFTHDVIVPFHDGLVLVYDTT